jgi:hypothetical protein
MQFRESSLSSGGVHIRGTKRKLADLSFDLYLDQGAPCGLPASQYRLTPDPRCRFLQSGKQWLECGRGVRRALCPFILLLVANGSGTLSERNAAL